MSLGNWQEAADSVLNDLKRCNVLSVFELLQENECRIRFILDRHYIGQIQWVDRYLKSCAAWMYKSTEKAKQFRNDGNLYFSSRKFKRASSDYTKSIIYAPTDSADLSLAYGNRSAVLMHLHDFQGCLDDISEALRCGYPVVSSYKLHHRRAQALVKLHRIQEATESYQHVLDIIKTQNCENSKKESITAEVHACLKNLGENKSLSHEVTGSDSPSLPLVVHGPNPLMTRASSSLAMRFTEHQGRHVVATRPLSAGDCLLVERPYASVLLPDHYDHRCHHCCGLLKSTYPCPHCTKVLFCSTVCRAHAHYHAVECHFLMLLHSIGIAHLSLRLILTTGVKSVLDYLSRPGGREMMSVDVVPGLDADGAYDASNYSTVFSLLTHEDCMDAQDLFQYSLTAVLLLKILEASGAITTDDPASRLAMSADIDGSGDSTSSKCAFSTIPEWRQEPHYVTRQQLVLIGGVLLKHILQLTCNGHAITDFVYSPSCTNAVETKREVRVATAMYPTASLLNHSCDPTIFSSFVGNIMITKSVKDVEAGEQIYNCYGPHYQRMSVAERRQVLKDQYFFDCMCEHCSSQPLYDIFQALRCADCDGPALPTSALADTAKLECQSCHSLMDSADAIGQFERLNERPALFVEAEELENSRQIKGAVARLNECYESQLSTLYKHNRRLAETEDFLARCYASLGNYKKSLALLEKQFATTQKMYGDDGIEAGHELQKMAEIAFNDKDVNRALLMVDRAMAIFVRHYEPTHTNITDLVKMKMCLLHVLKSR